MNKKNLPKKYLLVGITGGIASGKSAVSDEFKNRGAYGIDADKIAREIVKPDMPAWKDIVSTFGNTVLQEDRSINRKPLAQIIFNDPEKKKLLEKITHPRIIKEQERIINDLVSKGYTGVLFIDAALLIESGYYKKMDIVVVVYTKRELQLQRLMNRDDISERDAEKRIDAQMPLEQKKMYADFIIENNGSLDNLKRIASQVYAKIFSACNLL